MSESAGSSTWRALAVSAAVAALVAMLASVQVSEWLAALSPSSRAAGFPVTVVGGVPHIDWHEEKPFAAEIAYDRMPVVIRESFVNTWPAFRLWDVEYLNDRLGNMNGVFVHSNTTFTLRDSEKPLMKLPRIARDVEIHQYKETSVSAKRFFDKSNPKEATYFVTSLSSLSGLKDDVKNVGHLDPNDHHDRDPSAFVNDPPHQNQAFLELSPGNTIVNTRYDVFHSFFCQIMGRTRFLIMPPDMADNVYLYPRFHPNYRSSQVDFDFYNGTKFPLAKRLLSYEIVLEPGEVLYVPPYWLHRTSNDEASASIRVSSDSIETLMYYDIQRFGFPPVSKDATKSRKMKLVRLYLVDLLTALKIVDPIQYLRELYMARYAPLEPQIPLDSFQKCMQDENESNDDAKIDADTAVTSHALGIAHVFLQLPANSATIMLGNYVEDVIAAFYGPLKVAPFLKNCFFVKKD